MSEAERIVELTRRIYLIALRPDCATLTRAEILRQAEEELAGGQVLQDTYEEGRLSSAMGGRR